MAIPTYDKFIEPILRFLAEHPEGVAARIAHEAAAETLQLTEADRQEFVPSGNQRTYKNRAGWAHDRLKRADLSKCPSFGFWQITDKGRAFVSNHQEPLTNEEVEQIANVYQAAQNLLPNGESLAPQPLATVQVAISSPDDRLGEAISELRCSVAEELLKSLSEVSPTYFEVVVLDLLHRMGYGTSRADLQRVGGTGDGGIDGIISLDKLGLEKVYVQAKRWQSVVGRPVIQGFYGALAGQHATKGIFITTSSYTTQAIEFANSVSVQTIVLVDGKRLAELMIDYEVGVSARTVKVPRLDTDYFDEEST